MGGYAPSFNEINDQTRTDLTKAELIAFPVLALLLLFVFRGVVAAAIPLLLGVISIVGTLLVLRVMSSFADTSLFALNIATGLSLGLAVDYALLLVSRYREEIGRAAPPARPTAAPSRPPAAPPSSPASPWPRRWRRWCDAAALPLLDGGRRRLGRDPLGGDRDPRRALAAGPARDPHRRPLDPPRPRRLRHLRRLVPARPRGDAAPGRGRPRQHRPDAGRRGAAAVDDPDRAQRRSGATREALLRRLPLPRRPLPARRHRGGHGHRRRRRRPGPAGRLPAPDRSGRRRRPRHSLRPASGRSPTPTSPSPTQRSAASRRTRYKAIRDLGRPAAPPPWSPATPPASSTRSRA